MVDYALSVLNLPFPGPKEYGPSGPLREGIRAAATAVNSSNTR